MERRPYNHWVKQPITVLPPFLPVESNTVYRSISAQSNRKGAVKTALSHSAVRECARLLTVSLCCAHCVVAPVLIALRTSDHCSLAQLSVAQRGLCCWCSSSSSRTNRDRSRMEKRQGGDTTQTVSARAHDMADASSEDAFRLIAELSCCDIVPPSSRGVMQGIRDRRGTERPSRGR